MPEEKLIEHDEYVVDVAGASVPVLLSHLPDAAAKLPDEPMLLWYLRHAYVCCGIKSIVITPEEREAYHAGDLKITAD